MSYKKHLSKDKKLAKILADHPEISLNSSTDIYGELISSIISQQLSVKVAKVIHDRFLNLFEKKNAKPQLVIEIEFKKLRSVGLSNSKTTYIKEVAQFAIEKGLSHKKLTPLSDDAVIDYLTQIKGVGKWTAQMLLMFTLGREDVFAVDDLGIQQAMIKAYKLQITDKKKLRNKMLQISESWKPFRTYACLHLWKWKDADK